MKRYMLTGLLIAGLGAGTTFLAAQEAGQRRGFDPEQARGAMMERIQAGLNATDEEMTVIRPLLSDVMAKRQAATAGRFGGMAAMGGPRGRADGPPQAQQGGRPGRPGGGAGPQVAGSEELRALNQAIESPNTTSAELEKRMAEVRAARQKAEAELRESESKLREVLTMRQEAYLLLLGFLN
jgi:hypothetical protein